MKYEKVIAFIVMTAIIIMSTIISINVFLNDKKNIGTSFIAEESASSGAVGKFLNLDEKRLSGEETLSDSGDVINQLESIMTYEDQMAFEVVKVRRGQKVLCSYGCSEFILSEGSATAVFDDKKGFIDVTSGISLENKAQLLQDHLYILIIESNSGAVVTSDEATFLIRGGYTIKE